MARGTVATLQDASAAVVIANLILGGHLVPIEVFGIGCEEYGQVNVDGTPIASECPCCKSCCAKEEWGYGLCDRCSTHSPGCSDCNRADAYMLRPSDAAMDDPVVRAALRAVLEDADPRLADRP